MVPLYDGNEIRHGSTGDEHEYVPYSTYTFHFQFLLLYFLFLVGDHCGRLYEGMLIIEVLKRKFLHYLINLCHPNPWTFFSL